MFGSTEQTYVQSYSLGPGWTSLGKKLWPQRFSGQPVVLKELKARVEKRSILNHFIYLSFRILGTI